MAASNVEKLLDVLNNNETNIEKIATVSHHFLLLTSMKNAREIKKEEADDEIFNKEEKIKKFKELVNLIYDEKIKILKEELLKQ